MMILWWRFLVRLADDRSDGMDSMHGELDNQVKFIRTPYPRLDMISPSVNSSSDRPFAAVHFSILGLRLVATSCHEMALQGIDQHHMILKTNEICRAQWEFVVLNPSGTYLKLSLTHN